MPVSAHEYPWSRVRRQRSAAVSGPSPEENGLASGVGHAASDSRTSADPSIVIMIATLMLAEAGATASVKVTLGWKGGKTVTSSALEASSQSAEA